MVCDVSGRDFYSINQIKSFQRPLINGVINSIVNLFQGSEFAYDFSKIYTTLFVYYIKRNSSFFTIVNNLNLFQFGTLGICIKSLARVG